MNLLNTEVTFSFSIEFVNKIFTQYILFLVIFYFTKMTKVTKGFSFVKNVWLWIAIAIVLVAWSWVVFLWNARYSEEFTSGVTISMKWEYSDTQNKEDIETFLKENGYEDIRVYLDYQDDVTTMRIQTRMDDDTQVSELSQTFKQYLEDQKIIENEDDITEQKITWPSVWSYMKKTTVRALIIGLIFIVIYLLISFATIRNYISPANLGLIVLITMVFDISLPLWAYGIWMALSETIQVDTIFIIALLTIMWYCINDTIVIFDRIRENLTMKKSSKDLVYWEVFEKSIRDSLNRSIATSISTLLVVIAMFIFGTWVIKTFSFTIWIWVMFGTFASIFLAAPIAYLLSWKYSKEKGKF